MYKKSLYGNKPFYLSKETWNSLTDRERDYICMLWQNKTRSQIMRRLYLKCRVAFWRLQKTVTEKIKNDVAKINKVK